MALAAQSASKAESIWKQMIEDHAGEWGMDIHQWDWVPGVGLIAMLEYGRSAGKAEVIEYLQQWVRRNREKAASARVINAVAPFAIFPMLFRATGDEYYRLEADRVARWLINEAPRTREDAFEHTVTEGAVFAEQVWADTLFMAVLFLARTAALQGSETLAEEAQRQVLIHLRLLEDPESGVLFHGWNCGSGDHMSGARWTRANAWVSAGVPLILQEIAPLVSIPEELTSRYARLMDGVLRFQREDGLWSTVMDRPDFYREVSGSAGIAYGLRKAVRDGWLAPEPRYEAAAVRALNAILPFIGEDGIVGGVSGGTPVMESIDAYDRIPVYPTLYGQGLALMLLSQQPAE